MAENPILENPIIVEAIEVFSGHLGDPDAIDSVQGVLDLVRAHILHNAALYAVTKAQLAVARQRYVEALVAAASELGADQDVELAGNSELVPRAAAYAELADRAVSALELHLLLTQALAFFLLLRAGAYASARAPLLPGVLATVAAAYALAYAVSGGAVVPGPASLVRISVLLLCFLFGFLD